MSARPKDLTDVILIFGLKRAINFIKVFFFFSSRRRHTRLQGDWSSDVCSSDLFEAPALDAQKRDTVTYGVDGYLKIERDSGYNRCYNTPIQQNIVIGNDNQAKIGRASCRERV